MEGLHPTNRGGECIPNPKVRLKHSTGMALKRRTSSSTHICMFLVVCTLKNAWATVQEGGLRGRAKASHIETVGDSIGGRCTSN